MQRFVALLAVIVFSSLLAVYHMHRNSRTWMPDSSIYLAMTLQDRGLTQNNAWNDTARFMRTTADGRMSPRLYSARAPNFFVEQRALFKNRLLYPEIASALPLAAPLALKVASTIAFGLLPLVIFFLVLPLSFPWLAAFSDFVFAMMQPVYSLAGLAMTDELALLFWSITFASLLVYYGARVCRHYSFSLLQAPH